MKLSLWLSAALGVATIGIAAGAAFGDNKDDNKHHRQEIVRATLVGFNEVPTLSSPASGRFKAVIDEDAGTISWELSYTGLPGVTQSHIHFGRRAINGGVMVFFCSNLGNGPAGTQACPDGEATLSGTIQVADMVGGAAAQGIAAGDFAEMLAAIRSGSTYANVHSATYPGGEIRGQVLESFR
ncbi:MAG TPA: CHRD domain-containing protein [Steroidobacteraceae bacterium]|nr:CHRD domain-containing protein [Steroidobacteraceae bacterium]